MDIHLRTYSTDMGPYFLGSIFPGLGSILSEIQIFWEVFYDVMYMISSEDR